jgi:spore coat protein U-like protein
MRVIKSSLLVSISILSILIAKSASAEFCIVRSAQPVHFGTYSPDSLSPHWRRGQIIVRCARSLHDRLHHSSSQNSLQIQFSAGSSNNYQRRELRNGTHKLYYNIFTQYNSRVVWGNGQQGSSSVPVLVTNGVASIVPVWAMIYPGQPVVPGRYSDLLHITVQF